MNLKDIQKEVAKSFIQMDEVVANIYFAHQNRQNVLLYGPRGHGKSEVVVKTLQLMGMKDPYILNFDKALTPAKLLGGIDLKEFKETGKERYMPDNSFMVHDAAIFEEFLDANPNTLRVVKDILTRKSFCQGTSADLCYPLRTQIVVACTNHDPASLKDEADQATMDRFAFKMKVEWTDYPLGYKHMALLLGYDVKIATLIGKISPTGSISPRMAINLLKVYKTSGKEGFNTALDQSMKSVADKHFSKIDAEVKCMEAVDKLRAATLAANSKDMKSVKALQNELKVCQSIAATEDQYQVYYAANRAATDKIQLCLNEFLNAQ